MSLYALYQADTIIDYVYAASSREAVQIYQDRCPGLEVHPVLLRHDRPSGIIWNRSIAADQEMELGVPFFD